MATAKVTKRSVDALRPASKNQFLWDEETRGFGLKVTPAGKKVFVFQYRLGGRGTPLRRYTIGAYGVWTPDEARDEAKRLRREFIDKGLDPVVQKAGLVRAATAFTVESVAQTFVSEYLKTKWKKSHSLADKNLQRIVKAIGKKPIAAVDEGDVEAILQGIQDDDGRPMKGAQRNTYAVANKFFEWAVRQRGIPLEKSPLGTFDPPEAPAERDHTLKDWELRLVWLAAGTLGYPFSQLFRLLILTGQRRDEVAAMDWGELNRGAACWSLPAARSKNGVGNLVHLTAAAIAELDLIAGGDNWPKRGLVFSTTGKTAVSGYSRAKRRLDAAVATLNSTEAKKAKAELTPVDSFRVHDFRRTMATGLQRLGFRWEVIEACENRISGQRRKGAGSIYQRHDWESEKKVAWEAWSDHIDHLIYPPETGNVVVLTAARS